MENLIRNLALYYLGGTMLLTVAVRLLGGGFLVPMSTEFKTLSKLHLLILPW